MTTEISDSNGFLDIKNVFATVTDKFSNFTKITDINETTSIFKGSFNFSSEPAGIYEVIINVSDSFSSIRKSAFFEYLPLVSIEINETSIDFGELEPGSISDEVLVSVKNNGNVNIDLELFGTDLISELDLIEVFNVKKIFNGTQSSLTYSPELVDANILPLLSIDTGFKLGVPPAILQGIYTGSITIVGVESEN